MAIASLVLCGIHSFVGFSACFVFLILGNYPAALWGLTTGLVSLQIFHLHFLEHRQQLDLSYTDKDIKNLLVVGITCAALAAIGFIFHMSIEIVTRKGITPVNESEVLRMVFSFMTFMVSVVLTFVSRRYVRGFSTEFIVPVNVEAAS